MCCVCSDVAFRCDQLHRIDYAPNRFSQPAELIYTEQNMNSQSMPQNRLVLANENALDADEAEEDDDSDTSSMVDNESVDPSFQL